MRFVMMHKADKNPEAAFPPSPELIAGMGQLMGEMHQAGALLGGEGLHPTYRTVRLNFRAGKRTVTHAPFTDSNGLISGFAVVRAASIDEAIELAARFADVIGDTEIDIGLVTEPWDLGFIPKPEGLTTSRFMIMYKADRNSETGIPASVETRDGMKRLIEAMTQTGVLLAAEALQPSSKGVRLNFSDGGHSETDGPFLESKELIGGYCVVKAESKQEAMAWAPRFAAVVRRSGNLEIDVRPLQESANLL